MRVRGDGRAIRLASKQRATPHPALRATFPSRAGEGTRAAIFRCVTVVVCLTSGSGQPSSPAGNENVPLIRTAAFLTR